MQVYRIEKNKYKATFPPKGSLFSNGRWHTKGMWIIYTSESIALAKLEILANTGSKIPRDCFLRIIEVKEEAPLLEIKVDNLPEGWWHSPYPKILANKIKAVMASEEFAGVIIPSAQSHQEKNILLFPDFPGFNKYVKEIGQVKEYFDPRLKS
jgi:RES domain-containing protein